jgi:hypothetical protein
VNIGQGMTQMKIVSANFFQFRKHSPHGPPSRIEKYIKRKFYIFPNPLARYAGKPEGLEGDFIGQT